MGKWKALPRAWYLVIAAAVAISLLMACSSGEPADGQPGNGEAANGETELVDTNAHLVMSVLWAQTAAEARALYYQAFNVARFRLDEALESETDGKTLAVVVDLDETVLDNSPCFAEMVKTDGMYGNCWLEWVDLAEAEALPGAGEFLDYAESQGVEVFYVSNRFEAQREATMDSLVSVGFPYVDDDHVLLREAESSKESRRQTVAGSCEIVLLIGDNLNDFTDVFEDTPVPERAAEVDALRDEFGSRFIVLPNSMCGDWEDAVYQYDRTHTDEEKDSLRKDMLQGYSE